jgi:hypothetical protein
MPGACRHPSFEDMMVAQRERTLRLLRNTLRNYY